MNGRFAPGKIVATPGVLEALSAAGQEPDEFLRRHLAADWGEDLCVEDRRLNNEALRDGSRILLSYSTRAGTKLWVITEACGDDGRRASTCLLLPEEY